MSNTVAVHISAGEPTDITLCPRCLHNCLATVPLTGVLESGVMPMGSVTFCGECDSAREVVAEYKKHGGTNS